jgi:PhnB protein
LVTRDPAVAAAWYGEVLGAMEEGRITLPGGRVLSVDLRFGDSRPAIGDEFPDLGIVSRLTLGGTYGKCLAVVDAAAVWQKALEASAEVFEPLHEAFWGDYTGQFTTRSVIAGPSSSASATCHWPRLPGWRRRHSAKGPG